MHGFRWKDWGDYRSALASSPITAFDQLIGTGDGVSRDFALRKAYSSGAQTIYRAITKPVAGSVLAGVGQTALTLGDDYTVDLSTDGNCHLHRARMWATCARWGVEF